jgi:hypothetical protein
MRKDNVIQFRMSSDDKEGFQAWATRLGISLSDLFAMLAYQHGPKELVGLVLSEYGLKTLNRLGLPLEALEAIQTNEELTMDFGYLLISAARAELANHIGDYATAAHMTRHTEQAESIFYRTYGKATKNQEQPAMGHHVTDAI